MDPLLIGFALIGPALIFIGYLIVTSDVDDDDFDVRL